MKFTRMQENGDATITLSGACNTDDPLWVVNWGHVSAKVMNSNFQNEGWSDPGHFTEADIKHVYGKCNGLKFSWVDLPAPGHKPLTVARWD